jgi:hypothetical protein
MSIDSRQIIFYLLILLITGCAYRRHEVRSRGEMVIVYLSECIQTDLEALLDEAEVLVKHTIDCGFVKYILRVEPKEIKCMKLISLWVNLKLLLEVVHLLVIGFKNSLEWLKVNFLHNVLEVIRYVRIDVIHLEEIAAQMLR